MGDPNPFVTGGPLPQNSRVYIERDADREAAQELQQMKYIALIEPHQQGKTSLIGHLMRMLPYAHGYCWVYVDLSLPELRQPVRWYAILGDKILNQVQQNCSSFLGILNPPTNNLTWSKFLETLSKGAAATNTNLVVALDEAAAVPSECAPDFFSTMRAVYNYRPSSSYYNRLSFIISCAYDPALLIVDSPISNALNLIKRIKIDDFTLNQTAKLVEHIPNLAAGDKEVVADRIYYWVDGHPSLSQYLCDSLLKDGLAPTSEGVDGAVQKFLWEDIQHWPSITRKLNKYPDLWQELERIILGNRNVFQPSRSSKIRALELMGLIKADSQNYCKIRNRLYEQLLKEQLERLETAQQNNDSRNTKRTATIEYLDRIEDRITSVSRCTKDTNPTAQIFLSYARPDEGKVKNLYQKLSDARFKPWMDKKDIFPGERWKKRIPRAIRNSDFILVCLSAKSVTKRGFLQKEIRLALDIWQEKLDSDIYLIPARLEDCEVPESLRDFQWVNLFEKDGWTQLVKAIQEGMERQTGKATDRQARRRRGQTRP